MLKRPVGSNGPFKEHAELPTNLDDATARPSKAARKPAGRKPKKTSSRPADKAAEQKAAVALRTPRSATNRAASVTVLASMPRTAKYPLSDTSADPTRPPSAKTSTQERAASGSDRSSPSLRAMSAIDRSMMVVETGSSTGSAASPNVPPAAPDAVASARCRNCELVRGEDRSVRNATLSAASSPFEVAEAMALEAKEGSA
jgi:hypothetical protein